jgi:hypothetical protein
MFDFLEELTAIKLSCDCKSYKETDLSNGSAKTFDMGKFNLKKLNNVEVKNSLRLKSQVGL